MDSKKLIATLASITALSAVAVGGVASAANNGAPSARLSPPIAAVSTTQAPTAPDTADATGGVDTLQVGDQTTADTGTEAAGTGQADANEPAGTEQADANEPAGTEQADANEPAGQDSGSEVAGDDGPGGHADEPGNPNADHQFDGVE